MSIKSKFKLVILGMIVITIAIVMIIVMTTGQANRAVEKGRAADQIVRATFELNILTSDYLLHHENRAKIQRQVVHDKITESLKSISAGNAEEQELLEAITQSQADTAATFAKLVLVYEKNRGLGTEGEARLNAGLEERLTSQLRIKSQTIVGNASKLADKSFKQRIVIRRQTDFLITLLTVGLSALVMFILIYFQRTIASRLTKLHQGTEVIGGGNLDYRVGNNSPDEIGQLAHSFNEMAEKLKKSKEIEQIAKLFSESIIDSIRSNIIVTDKHGVVTALNPAAERMWGIKKKETLGKNFFTLELRGTAVGLKKDMETVMKTKKTFHVKDLSYKTQAGEESFIDISYVPLVDAQGNLQGAVSVGDDTTETRRLRENLQRLEKLATIGKLAGVVGHEIRNPLGVIRASIYFINLKLKNSLDEKVKKHMRILETEIDSADKIISDILGFARIKEPVLADAEINSVIQETLAKAGISKTIKVQVRLGENLPRVKVDVLQIKQVFSNLISNALQAMPQGGKFIVTTGKTNTSLFIAFHDTGAGIPKENLDKLFTPLFTTKVKGIGLGLITCQIIVESHQGKIEVESQEGKGSTFTVTLPLA